MTEAESKTCLRWIVGAFPSWMAREADEDKQATYLLYRRNLESLPFERTFDRVKRLCKGVGRPEQARPFAPALGELLAAVDVDNDAALLLHDRAMAEGGVLHRDPYNPASVTGWVYVPKGLSAPRPQAQLAAPTDDPPASYIRPNPTQNRMRLDRHDRQRAARRLAALLPAPPARPEAGKEAVG